jgi:hypothetical protein
MPVTRAAIGKLLPRPFAGVSYLQRDMTTEFFSCYNFPNCHSALFITAVLMLIILCAIAPLVLNRKLREDELKFEKLERRWKAFIIASIAHTIDLDDPDLQLHAQKSEAAKSSSAQQESHGHGHEQQGSQQFEMEQFKNTLNDPSIQRARAQLTKRVLNNPEIKAMVRDQCYGELRYSLLSRKYERQYANIWFVYELFRKLLINVLFLLGQNSGVEFQWKLWVFLVLALSILLNVVLQPYYHAMDNRQEAIALTGLLLILYVASTEGQVATGGQWDMDIDSQSYFWVQTVSLAVLLVVVLVFTVTFTLNSRKCRNLMRLCTYSHAKRVKKAPQTSDADADAISNDMVQYQVTIITHENNAAPEMSSGLRIDLMAKLDAAYRSDDQSLIERLQMKLGQGAKQTQGIADAGVDSSVYIAIRGDLHSSVSLTNPCRHAWTDYYRLTQRNRDNFEPGNVDTFTFLAPDVGTMHSLEIGHDGKTKALNTLRHRPWSERGLLYKVFGRASWKPLWWVESMSIKHLATLQTMTLAGCEVDAGEPHSEDQPCAMRLLVADGWNAAARRWHP